MRSAARFANPLFEDYANLLMEFENDAVGFVEVNWLTPMKVRKVSFTCSGGFVQMDYTDQSLEVSTSKVGNMDQSDMFRIPLEYDVRKVSVKKEEPLKTELERFLEGRRVGNAGGRRRRRGAEPEGLRGGPGIAEDPRQSDGITMVNSIYRLFR